MSDIAESAVQAALVDRLTKPDLGWRFVAGAAIDRTTDAVLVESEVIAALTLVPGMYLLTNTVLREHGPTVSGTCLCTPLSVISSMSACAATLQGF